MRQIGFIRAACRACVALAASCLVSLAWSQTNSAAAPLPPALSLTAALDWALQHHPDLRAAALERDAAEGATRQAGALPNPELSTLLEDTRHETRTTTIQLNQPIELGGKRSARVKAAEWAQRQADTDQTLRQAQIKAQVRTAFYGLAVASEKVRLARELEQLATHAREAAARRVAAGKVSPVEEVKAKVAEAQARASTATTQSEWRTARQQLLAALGGGTAPVDTLDARIDQLPTLPAWPQIEERLARSPWLSRAQQEIQRREALSELERAKAIPDLTVNLGVKRDQQLGRDQPIVGVSFVLPLFDGNQGGLLEASRREDKARAEQEALLGTLRSQVTEAFEQLSASLAQAHALRDDVLPGARQALSSATKGYEMGKFNFIDVLDAQRTLFDAETQALAATAQAFRADARLLELLGDSTVTRD